MSKHTPGPWRAKRIYGGTYQVTAAGSYLMSTTNNEANAYLIAAAPDLLKACKNAFIVLESQGHLQARQLQGAIAKARLLSMALVALGIFNGFAIGKVRCRQRSLRSQPKKSANQNW